MEKEKKICKGNRSIIIPEKILKTLENNKITKNLDITSAGYCAQINPTHEKFDDGLNEYVLIYCVNGVCQLNVNGEKFNVKAQQFFIIPKKTPFTFGIEDNNLCSIYWIYFKGEQDNVFNPIYNKLLEIKVDDINRIEGRILIFDEIFRNLETDLSTDDLEYANICLWYLLASFRYIKQFREIRRVRSIDIIQQAILYMKENIENKISLTDIASSIGLSPSYFSMLFSKKMDCAPMDYLNNLRVDRACQYLENNNIKIKELSERLGFYDQFHFSKTFKKHKGCTPSEYKKDMKK